METRRRQTYAKFPGSLVGVPMIMSVSQLPVPILPRPTTWYQRPKEDTVFSSPATTLSLSSQCSSNMEGVRAGERILSSPGEEEDGEGAVL